MHKVELLMPCGNYEALKQAVYNGADAVYLGLKKFGARAGAYNFEYDELIEAVKLCHINNVKVYVTVNTLLDEDEIDEAIEMIKFLYNHDVDAIVIQDLGLLEICHQRFPNLELHISTQMFIHNVVGIRFLKQFNVTRVVLARETPIDIIEQCIKEGLAVEVFVYGALCTSYSGQCLMSSLLKNRSGNKGACAQLCRLPYSLHNETTNKTYQLDQYLLSLKDLNLLGQIDKLIAIGVTSFKIEGRMKRSAYVGYLTRVFRTTIDIYYKDKLINISEEITTNLKKLFNRGFTEGYTFNDINIYNHKRPNHMGIEIGEVVKIKPGFISVKLSRDLHQHDGLRIVSSNKDVGLSANKIYVQGLLVNKAHSGTTIELNVCDKVNVNDKLLLTSDTKQLKYIDTFTLDYLVRIDVKLSIDINIDRAMFIAVDDGYRQYYIKGDEYVQIANNKPMTFERISEQLSQTSSTPYNFVIEVKGPEHVFISLNQLNRLRRAIIELLDISRTHRNYNREILDYIPPKLNIKPTRLIIAEINTTKQKDLIKADKYITSNTNIVAQDIEYLPKLVNQDSAIQDSKYINNLGDLYNNKFNDLIATHNLNITNSYALALLYQQGVNLIFVSLELNDQQITKMLVSFKNTYGIEANIGLFKYGHRSLMVSKYCIIKACLQTKDNCMECQRNQYSLVQYNIKYPLLRQGTCTMNILEAKPYRYSGSITDIHNYYYRYTIE